VSGLPRKGTKYRLVTLELLVPVGREMFMDVLSDFRDDNPDELVEWTQLKNPCPSVTREEAIAAWKFAHNETLDIKETE
jgi:predicted metal-dependent hydrolase